jgi:NADH-quinone oxidoreductase subunit M
MNFPWLTVITFVPLAGALVIGSVCRSGSEWARRISLTWHGAVLVLVLMVAGRFDGSAGGMQFSERHAWMPGLGVEYHLGVDGLGLVAILLAAAVPFFAALVSSRAAGGREPLYYSLLLVLECGLLGTFSALNFFHWFLFWELSLVPAYLLVRLFGGEKSGAASFQFFVYTMVGSVALLLSFLALRAAGGSFDFLELAEVGRRGDLSVALSEQVPWAGFVASGEALMWVVFGGVLLGFAVKVPLWPFHTWLPDTYAEAPSAVTMVLTGVLSKMGIYGLLRIALPIFPQQFAAAEGVLVILALATVVLPALAAFAQGDLKRVLAYSSINHLGYCLLAVFAVNPSGGAEWTDRAAAPAFNGVLLQMLNHGLTAASLFAFVELLERRTGGFRDLAEFGGLRRTAPVFCGLMGITIFASVGLPGLNGFISEFLIFKGVFAAAPWAAAVALAGLLATAVFYLSLIQRVFHGPLDSAWSGFPDLTPGERMLFGVPVALMFLLGIYPQVLLRMTNSTALQWAGN